LFLVTTVVWLAFYLGRWLGGSQREDWDGERFEVVGILLEHSLLFEPRLLFTLEGGQPNDVQDGTHLELESKLSACLFWVAALGSSDLTSGRYFGNSIICAV